MLELPFTDHAFDMVMPNGSVVTAKVLDSIDEWLDEHNNYLRIIGLGFKYTNIFTIPKTINYSSLDL